MKSLSQFENIFIFRKPVDMRKSINGLSVIVDQEMKIDLRKNFLFLFVNRRRTHIKMLYFDKSGFALWLKRLEESRFPWMKKIENEVVEMTSEDLELLLDGVNVWTRFERVHFEHVV